MNDHQPDPAHKRPSLPLGPFELHARIARGGMGEVWRGIHVRQQVPVAIKVITAARARRTEILEAFRNEVRAIAGLDHPGIVTVFDHGTIPARTEQLSGGALVTGSPYLVMEMASRGSLSRLKEPLRWGDLRRVLQALLQSLAHAHARGVIHRDLKPGNVLMAGPDDVRPGLKLTDFGIAHVVDSHTRADSRNLTMGTPLYMAPEQIEGRWRDYGPWTDLYAIGCMSYRLASGRFPFESKNFHELVRLHRETAAPPLAPPNPMPEGFEAWLGRLMQKNPHARFQQTADALHALLALGDDEGAGLDLALDDEEDGDNATLSELAAATIVVQDGAHLITTGRHSARITASVLTGQPQDAPPMPESWVRTESAPNLQLLGAGLGLYGLRTIPLVDRQDERDRLWEALAKVHRERQPRAVVLSGPAGVGKSRVVEWICERAHEVGAATFMLARHSPIAGPGFGLPGMLAHHHRCAGLERTHAHERVRALLSGMGVDDAHEWAALTELMAPTYQDDPAGAPGQSHLHSTRERHALMLRHLTRLASQRPLIVWLDDVQWGTESLEFVEYALSRSGPEPSPLLFFLTARDEALAEENQARARLARAITQPGADIMTIGRLAPEDCASLVQGLLVLQGNLAAQVEVRSAGNPQFAIQLVGDWVQRGVLEVGPQGFVLRPGEQAVLPDSLYGVWGARVNRLLEGHSDDARLALELAAILGHEVEQRDWEMACHNASVSVPPGLLDRLLGLRLATRLPSGWAFVHGMLRETLERSAREEGRFASHHATCAATITQLHPHGGHGVAERRGRHLLGAGHLEQAIDALFTAANERVARQEIHVAQELLRLRQQAMDQLGIPPSDPRQGQGLLLESRALAYLDQLPDAHALATNIEARARTFRWPLWGSALCALGDIARRRGDFEAAADHYQHALSPLEAAGDQQGLANALHGLSEVVFRRGDAELADDLTTKALRLFRQIGDHAGVAMSLKMLGQIAKSRHDLTRCVELFDQALDIYERIGHRFGLANTHNVLADVARHRGELEEAERGYREALKHFHAVGARGLIPQLNLGLVLLARDRFDDAYDTFSAGLIELEAAGGGGFLLYAHIALLVCAPARNDWAAWDHHMHLTRELLQKHVLIDRDIAWCAERAGLQAALYAQPQRAGDAYAIALDQYKALGDDDKVSDIGAAWALLAT